MLCQSGRDPESCYIVRKRGLDQDLEEVGTREARSEGWLSYKMGEDQKEESPVEKGLCVGIWTFNLKQRPEKGAKWGNLMWEEDQEALCIGRGYGYGEVNSGAWAFSQSLITEE